MSTKCFLLGHKGNDLESGYHVCSRCGLHEYWDNSKIQEGNGITNAGVSYEQNAILFHPYYIVKYQINKAKTNIYNWWKLSINNELPF